MCSSGLGSIQGRAGRAVVPPCSRVRHVWVALLWLYWEVKVLHPALFFAYTLLVPHPPCTLLCLHAPGLLSTLPRGCGQPKIHDLRVDPRELIVSQVKCLNSPSKDLLKPSYGPFGCLAGTDEMPPCMGRWTLMARRG